ncbi:hypothetical protein MTO96_022923 [Rhipicephalus appendiculatus]
MPDAKERLVSAAATLWSSEESPPTCHSVADECDSWKRRSDCAQIPARDCAHKCPSPRSAGTQGGVDTRLERRCIAGPEHYEGSRTHAPLK